MNRTTARTALVLFAVFAFAGSSSALQTTHQVNVDKDFFSPSLLTIDLGDTVDWVWIDGRHNVESGVMGVHDGNFYSGPPIDSDGLIFSVTFDAAFLAANPMPSDTYPYYCVLHLPGMTGTVVVNVPGTATEYGCGTNPSGSLALVAGAPSIGTTFTMGVDNPLGSQPAGSLAFLAVSLRADPNYPCGTQVPGFGMSGPGAFGEVLVGIQAPDPVLLVGPAVWTGAGSPAALNLPLPADPALVGQQLFLQGVLIDATFTSGVTYALTNGIEVTMGS
jgi:plastocyanin